MVEILGIVEKMENGDHDNDQDMYGEGEVSTAFLLAVERLLDEMDRGYDKHPRVSKVADALKDAMRACLADLEMEDVG